MDLETCLFLKNAQVHFGYPNSSSDFAAGVHFSFKVYDCDKDTHYLISKNEKEQSKLVFDQSSVGWTELRMNS